MPNPVARALLFACCAVWLGSEGVAQVSPGPLSKAHHDLDGPLQCAKCHAFGAGSAQFRCVECHQEIAHRLTEKRGYHALQVKASSGSNDCARCHSEHAGATHQVVRWPVPKEKLDHVSAGWKLEGKHAQLKCAECHTAKYIDPQDKLVLKRRDLNASFAGLDTNCATCHRDVHAGQLTSRCLDCHSQDTWKNPPGFAHDRSRYPLTGSHATVACENCHGTVASSAGPVVKYKDFVQFNTCGSCHKDPHGSAFGVDCVRCHATKGWKQILPGNGFDHSRTNYPLLGKHATVECKGCHQSENFKTHVAFERCLDCHVDQHGGQLARRTDGGDCKACHVETGWKPAQFTLADHEKTAYPLLGKHAQVECAKCHVPKGKDTLYKVSFAACTECHQDAHKGQFATKAHNNRREHCHDAALWKPANYSLATHNQTSFALKGAHVAVPCSGCHASAAGDIPYHPEATKCTACHQNVHGQLDASTTCETCHSIATWKEAGRFDHSRTAFPLLGRHAAVNCLACHKPVVDQAAQNIPFHGAEKDCAGCHADVHGGQFEAAGNEKGCAQCHTVLSWKPTEFDHSRHSTFSLNGAHEKVPCRMCHDQHREADGHQAVVYKGTPRECQQCHQ